MKAWWPELLFAPATPAAMKISEDRPDVLPPGSPFDTEFNPARVRIFIDDSGIVKYVPIIG
nr:unnamed protein product [Digitaria exilis]